FFFSCSCPPPALHSFPTRRSSDLPAAATHPESEHRLRLGILCVVSMTLICGCRGWTHDSAAQDFLRSSSTLQQLTLRQFPHKERSEEHTSELQSRFDLVCRLLLEK